MTEQRDEPQFESRLREAARTYHAPGPAPREEMWARIAAERARRRTRRRALAARGRRWGLAGLGIAALLALGIGIGRWTTPGTGSGPERRPSAPAGETGGGLAYRIAATQCLSGAETFLTAFRADVRDGRWDGRAARQAGDLLSTARLLLDSPAGRDPRLRALLEELELVLAQIAQLAAEQPDAAEIGLITHGLEQRGVLTRLRSAIPAGPAVSSGGGVL